MIRRIAAFLAVVATIAALLAAVGAQVTLNALGVPISLGDRLATAGRDIVGIGPVLAIALVPFALVFFLIAGLGVRFALMRRVLLFGGAGALSVLGLVTALALAFELPVLSAARTGEGLAALAIAGALGAALYAWLGPRSKATG